MRANPRVQGIQRGELGWRRSVVEGRTPQERLSSPASPRKTVLRFRLCERHDAGGGGVHGLEIIDEAFYFQERERSRRASATPDRDRTTPGSYRSVK